MSVKYAILNAMMFLTVLAFPLQCAIDPSAENIASVCIVVFSSMAMLSYIKWGGAADDQPLSTMAIFGFCVTTQLGALLVQTGFWTPLRISLYNPILTFATLAFYQAIAIAVHMVYRYFSVSDSNRVGMLRGILGWAGVYRVPPSRVLWFMGCVGLVSFIFSSRMGVIARVASGFNFLAWAPFLLPMYMREMGPRYCNARRNKAALVVYAGMVVVLGIALNVRVIMFIGVVTIALLYLLLGMRSRAGLEAKAVKQIAVVALAMLAISPALSDLATAMALARGARGHVSPVEMVSKTVSILRRPGLLAEARRERSAAVSRYAVYDEHYIANPLLARFVETKFHDNALHFAKALTTEQAKDQLRKVTIDATWAALPSPVLRRLHINVDKEDLNFSMGDYLAYLSRGVPLGGRKTGSMFAQGEAILGPLFPILYAAICLLIFGLMDLLTVRGDSKKRDLSTLAMMSLWMFFYRGITSDALSNCFVFIIRDFAQTVLIYVAVFMIARLILGARLVSLRAPIESEWQQTV